MNILQFSKNFFMNTLRKVKPLFTTLLISFTIALLCHLFFLLEWLDGRYMTGINDGLSQMLPFKKLLYDSYTNGEFFYSNQFGMGGGIFSQLSYYFSTSIIFLLTVGVTFILESTHLIQKPDLFYWADLILVISIIRMSLIISVTTLYFRNMNIQKVPAFIGAIVYGTSVIYIRHVTYWEFFADAMLWLPLLLIGVEKIIKEKKAGWFIAAVAISLFDNFYFAYINFLVVGIYIIFRWINPLSSKETSKIEQIKIYVGSGLAGFGISAISFIPAVYSYVNNHRLPYEEPIPFFGIPDNLLIDGRIIILPAFVVLCLCIFSFYKQAIFRLFACLTMLSILFHFSPQIASVFNGFSAPQYRWEYFLSLTAGGVVATGLHHIQQITKRQAFLAIVCTLSIYVIAYGAHFGVLRFMNKDFSFFTLKTIYLPIAAMITLIFFALYKWKKNQRMLILFAVVFVCVNIYTNNVYQMVVLPSAEGPHAVTKEFMESDTYNGKDQRELVSKIQEKEGDSFYRIDWMAKTRNNTPIVQDFNGFSVYSSILNKHLLFYYLYDLEIDMGRESVSRYMTLGNRANLYSILSGKYMITEKGKKAIPYQFKEIFSAGNYLAYENTNSLPFFRTTNTVYAENDFENASMIAKERAMIQGIILNKDDLIEEKTTIPESANLMDDVTIHTVDATYQDNQVDVKEKSGSIDLLMNRQHAHNSDYYVSFHLKRLDKDKEYKLKVNDYVTSRKKNSSIYKTGVDKLTIRVAAEDRISIRLPKGTYEFADLEIYEEEYSYLQAAKKEDDKKPDVPVSWVGNQVDIVYTNVDHERFATLPIPYEKGWSVFINGKKSEVLQANYAFMGLLLEEGVNTIRLVYYPPYFFLSLFITVLTIFIVFLIMNRKRKEFFFKLSSAK